MQDSPENLITTPEEVHYCAVHPDRETELRCISCNRYMCVQCAIRTPVGYRCRECVRGQQQVFFKAKAADDVIAGAVCLVLTAVAAGIMSLLPFGIWIALILGLPAGGGISEVALRASGRRRSRQSHWITAGACILGGVIGLTIGTIIAVGRQWPVWVNQLGLTEAISRAAQSGITNIGALIFIGMIVVAVYGRYRMKM